MGIVVQWIKSLIGVFVSYSRGPILPLFPLQLPPPTPPGREQRMAQLPGFVSKNKIRSACMSK